MAISLLTLHIFLLQLQLADNMAQYNNVPTIQIYDSHAKEKNSSEKMSVLERKLYLRSRFRKNLRIFQREMLYLSTITSKHSGIDPTTLHKTSITPPPKLNQCVLAKLTGMISITLNKMNPTEDFIFENTFLELAILEVPDPFNVYIRCVAEDGNGDPTSLYIYNVEKDAETLKKFQPGCKLAILNPYMITESMIYENGIRNDKPECIIHLRKVENMCRFCGEENATRKCKRSYC